MVSNSGTELLDSPRTVMHDQNLTATGLSRIYNYLNLGKLVGNEKQVLVVLRFDIAIAAEEALHGVVINHGRALRAVSLGDSSWGKAAPEYIREPGTRCEPRSAVLSLVQAMFVVAVIH
eukprot:4688189-Prymnesium_polylepis.2